MNTVPDISSRQGITSSLGAKEKSGEDGVAGELLEGVAGGRSISPAAERNAPAIASARQDAGITEAVSRTSLCQWTVQEAASGAVSATPVNGAGSGEMQLLCKLEAIAKAENLAAISTQENSASEEQQAMLALIKDAYRMAPARKSADANDRTNTVCQYYREHSSDHLVGHRLYQCMAYNFYADNEITKALNCFAVAGPISTGPANFPERFLVMHLMLGMNAAGKSTAFSPREFYDEIQKWLAVDEAEDEEIVRALEAGFGQDAPQIKMFRDAIKAVFEDKGADPAASGDKFEKILNKLARDAEDGSISGILEYSVPMLKFAKNFRLIEQGCFDDVVRNQCARYEYLDQCLDCEIKRKKGCMEDAIDLCRRSMETGSPFSGYLEELMWEKEWEEEAIVNLGSKEPLTKL